MEQAIASMDAGVEKMTWILDFEHFGERVSDADSKRTSRETLHMLQNHYPERVRKCNVSACWCGLTRTSSSAWLCC
jgi:hypothetical protein